MIRWINDHLGTAPASDPSITGDLVVLDVRDLVDKFGNSPVATREKIEQGAALLAQGKRVVVCCDYGISRSNAIAAGVLSLFRGIKLDRAVKEVVHAIGLQEIKLDPLRSVRNALQEDEGYACDEARRILITGGSGFIGRNLLRKLSDRFYVVAPSRGEADIATGALSLDLLAKEHRINCLVHLANPRVYTSNQAFGESLAMLRNVLDICRENNIRLIYPSNWEVYSGYRTGEILAGAGLPLFPIGPYGEMKMFCENLIDHHRKLYDLKCGILRSSSLYGEDGDRPKFIYNFVEKAKKNEPIRTHIYLNGAPKLDLLYVSDFVSALITAIERDFTGTLNIGTGRTASTREIAEFIIKLTGSGSSLDSVVVQDYTANIKMDTSSAEKILDWRPSITWEEGISRFIEYQTGRKSGEKE